MLHPDQVLQPVRPADRVGPSVVTVGDATTLDGSASLRPEHRGLGYQWRLAVRPESSTTLLAIEDASTLMFVPDVTGEYGRAARL